MKFPENWSAGSKIEMGKHIYTHTPTHTHTQHRDLKSLLLLLFKKESRLTKGSERTRLVTLCIQFL